MACIRLRGNSSGIHPLIHSRTPLHTKTSKAFIIRSCRRLSATTIRSKCTPGKCLYRLCLFNSRCFICHSIGTDRDENSIKVHLSLCVPKQSTKIEGGGKEFSIADLWLSPILFSEFPSISPTASKKTVDRTPRATEKKLLSSHFSLRMVEFVSFYVILFSGAEGVCVCANVSPSLFFSLMFFPSPSPLSHCHVRSLSLSVCPSSCLSASDPQISMLRIKRACFLSEAPHVNTDLTLP